MIDLYTYVTTIKYIFLIMICYLLLIMLIRISIIVRKYMAGEDYQPTTEYAMSGIRSWLIFSFNPMMFMTFSDIFCSSVLGLLLSAIIAIGSFIIIPGVIFFFFAKSIRDKNLSKKKVIQILKS